MTTGVDTKNKVPGAVVPDGGWGWAIVFASFMIHFIMDGITYSMGEVFLHPMIDYLDKKRGPVATIFGILPAVTLAIGPVATIFTNVYGCRRITIIGALLAAVGFLASYFFANLWFYYFAIGIVGGVGFGLMYLPAIVSVGFYFEKKRSFAMGIAVCGSGLGTMAFPAIMPYIINVPLWLDYHGALLLEAAVTLGCIIFGVLMIPLPQEPSEIRRAERKARSTIKRQAIAAKAETEQQKEQQDQLLASNSESENQQQQQQANVGEDAPVVVSRKDAMYQGSLHNIPLYTEDSEEYHRQMITTSDMIDEKIANKKVKKKSFIGKIAEQIDLNLLKDAAFALLAVSNFLTSLGFNVPYNFANDLATDAKVPEYQRRWILMSIGFSNCFGRVVIGYLADRSWVNRLGLYNTTLIIAGIATICAPFCNSLVATHMVYATLFGFFSGGYVGLTSIVIVDLVGVDKLSDGFGVLLLFQGVAVAIGTPIAGAMRDAFAELDRPYFWPYLLFGSSILFSGVILFAIPILKRRKERLEQPTKHQLEMGVLSFSKQNLSIPEPQQV